MEEINLDEPQHMSVDARNRRLYKTLMEMGLFVVPNFDSDHTSEIRFIESLTVSCGDPFTHYLAGDLDKTI